MGYQQLLKVGLRHRPQIFIIGEIRDPQTAQMAVQAALSGHLVMATVHARNVYGALTRLEQLNVDDFYLQQAVSCVCYQRLLPTVKKQLAVLFDLLADDALQLNKHWLGNLNRILYRHNNTLVNELTRQMIHRRCLS